MQVRARRDLASDCQICAASVLAGFSLAFALIGGYLHGRATTQVALRDGVGFGSPLAEFTAVG